MQSLVLVQCLVQDLVQDLVQGSTPLRFALACNSSEKIIEPIQSRCAMLRYSKLTDAQVSITMRSLTRDP